MLYGPWFDKKSLLSPLDESISVATICYNGLLESLSLSIYWQQYFAIKKVIKRYIKIYPKMPALFILKPLIIFGNYKTDLRQ